MSMTKLERMAKEEVLNILSEDGYPTYAKLLSKFDVNLTADPGVVGYMEPSKGRIVLNKGLDIDQVSVIARHEILHEYLTHEMRLLQHLAQSAGLDYNDLDDIKVKELKRDLYKNKNFNIAGDYEISNRGYTERDKDTVRNIKLNGQTLTGLVTEDDHPEWVNMSVEEMYDELNNLMQQEQKNAQQDIDSGSDSRSGDSSDSGESGESSGTPQIGDKGDSQIQQAEEIARQAEEIADEAAEASDEYEEDGDSADSESSGTSSDGDSIDGMSGNPSNNSSSSDEGDDSSESEGSSNNPYDDLEQNAEEVSNAANNLKDKIEQEQEKEDDTVFKTPEEKAKDAENEARLNDIKRMFDDLQTASKILDETEEAVRKEQRIKAERNLSQYKASPLQSFKLSLQGFIKNQISTMKGTSWSKINKTYAHSGVLKPGRTRYTSGKIPLINVYFDQSGSWGPSDISVGEQAISTLNKYVKQGDIDIKLYYFSNNVHGDAASARSEGGTDLDPVIKHINSTKPDNVIVMTDSDGDWTTYSSSATVPGAVWFLWRKGVSKALQDHLQGKQLTKSFKLE